MNPCCDRLSLPDVLRWGGVVDRRLCRFDAIPSREFTVNKRRNPIPDVRIVLDLVVGFIEKTGQPTIIVTADVFVFVHHVKVAEDCRSLCIGCGD